MAGQDDSFYQTKFMTYLMGEFWGDVQKQLIRKEFYPYLGSMMTSIFFMHYALYNTASGERSYLMVSRSLGIATLIFISRALYQELKQMYSSESKLEYFLSFWNMIDLTYLLSIVFLVFATFPYEPLVSMDILRVIAAFSSFFMI